MSDEPKEGIIIPMRSTLRDIVSNNQNDGEEFYRPVGFSSDDDKQLAKLNEKHAVVANYHGKPMILDHLYCEVLQKERVDFITPDSLAFRYSNQSMPVMTGGGRPGVIELGKWWLKHMHRREYPSVVFDPTSNERDQYGAMVSNGRLNMWTGFGVEPKKGSWYYTKRHIWKILSNRNKEKFKYFMRWMAWALQNPDKPAEVAVVFKGKKGSGKGVMANALVRIFGAHGAAIANRKHLTGQFNGHLDNTCFMFADEAYYPGDKEVEGVLKALITEPTLQVEDKFVRAAPRVNRLKLIMCTNNDWVVSASADERRFYINEVADDYTQAGRLAHKRILYFNRIFEELYGDGIRAMVYDLQKMNLKTWHPRGEVPKTEELSKQMFNSLNYAQKAMYELLAEGVFPGTNKLECTGQNLWAHIKNIYPEIDKAGNGAKMNALVMIGAERKRTPKGTTYKFPSLQVCRMRFVKECGQPPMPFAVDCDDEWTYKAVDNDF